MDKRIARCVVDLALDQIFDYIIPENLLGHIHIGSRVTVPFRSQQRDAYVVDMLTSSSYPKELKTITSVHPINPFLPQKLITLGEWIAKYYCCPRELGIRVLIPAAVRKEQVTEKTRKTVRLNPEIPLSEVIKTLEKKKAYKQLSILQFLRLYRQYPLHNLTEKFGNSSGIYKLRDEGVVLIEEERVMRDPFKDFEVLPDVPLRLNPEQQIAYQKIVEAIEKGTSQVILLFGVTGSGKTEIYMQAITRTLEMQKQAIVLVPEISLTPQTVYRFRARFGNRISVMHSHLSDGERFDEWTRIREGQVDIVIGARSALFAPFERLGLLIVDEEHEPSYKQTGQQPFYHARDVAVMRGKIESCVVVLGSATPSIESFYNAQQGKYQLATLKSRVDNHKLPTIELVDMAQEKADQQFVPILSRRLRACMDQALAQGEQIMLFLNRRGFATQLSCEQCGFVAQCKNCDMSYTYHRFQNILVCHLCGHMAHPPDVCPECKNPRIRFSGIGTERVVHAVQEQFPYAKIIRMDSDTVTRKHAYDEILSAFRAHRADILVGTQMIAKGHHFPNVTLVGVINADATLRLPDLRGTERTFQLLVQVAGRSGRGEIQGHVIVQTFLPFHPTLQAALTQDYEAFYSTEIEARYTFQFPPITRLALIRLRSQQEELLIQSTHQIYELLQHKVPPDTKVHPPTPAPVPRIKNEYYYQILLSTKNMSRLSNILRQSLRTLRGKSSTQNKKSPSSSIHIYVDIDPVSIL